MNHELEPTLLIESDRCSGNEHEQLDIPAKEMLEAALQDYNGTVLIVSHDRYFISQVANKIVEI